jgi:hypothetical protein
MSRQRGSHISKHIFEPAAQEIADVTAKPPFVRARPRLPPLVRRDRTMTQQKLRTSAAREVWQ